MDKVKASSDARYQRQTFDKLKTEGMHYSQSGELYLNPLFDFALILKSGALDEFLDQYINIHHLPQELCPTLDAAAERLAVYFLTTQVEVNIINLMVSLATVKLVSKNRLYVIWAKQYKKSYISNIDNLIQFGGIDSEAHGIVFQIQFLSDDGTYLLSEAGEHIKLTVYDAKDGFSSAP